MSSYNPPIENVPEFDTLLFTDENKALTKNEADKFYLKFPNAQGTENLQKVGQTITGNNIQYGDSSTYSVLTTGTENSVFGKLAGSQITTGIQNTAVGFGSADALTTGNNNTFIGHQAGHLTTSGIRNTAVGNFAGQNANNSTDTIAIGHHSQRLTASSGAVAVGSNSGEVSQGIDAIAIGNSAGNSAQGDNGICIGARAGQNGCGQNTIIIGSMNSGGNQSNTNARNIVINATGTALSPPTATDRCYITPIRGAIDSATNQILCQGATGTEVVKISKTSLVGPFQITSSAVDIGFTTENTNAGTNGSILKIYKNSASPAIADIVGDLRVSGNTSTANDIVYSRILTTIEDPITATCSSSVGFSARKNNVVFDFMKYDGANDDIIFSTSAGTAGLIDGISNTLRVYNDTTINGYSFSNSIPVSSNFLYNCVSPTNVASPTRMKAFALEPLRCGGGTFTATAFWYNFIALTICRGTTYTGIYLSTSTAIPASTNIDVALYDDVGLIRYASSGSVAISSAISNKGILIPFTSPYVATLSGRVILGFISNTAVVLNAVAKNQTTMDGIYGTGIDNPTFRYNSGGTSVAMPSTINVAGTGFTTATDYFLSGLY